MINLNLLITLTTIELNLLIPKNCLQNYKQDPQFAINSSKSSTPTSPSPFKSESHPGQVPQLAISSRRSSTLTSRSSFKSPVQEIPS